MPKELKDRKDFRLIGKARAAPRHPAQGQRHGAIRHRREAAGHGLRLDAPFARAQRAGRHLDPGKQDQSAAAPESWNDAEIKAIQGRARGGQAAGTGSPWSPTISKPPRSVATRSR